MYLIYLHRIITPAINCDLRVNNGVGFILLISINYSIYNILPLTIRVKVEIKNSRQINMSADLGWIEQNCYCTFQNTIS